MERFSRLYDRSIEALAIAAGVIVAAVCLLIVYDVIARNLGLQPPSSTIALTEYALLYFTMLTAPYLVRERGHIVVEVLYRRIARRARKYVDHVVLVVCAFTAAIVSVLATILMIEAIQRGEIEIRSLDAPRWILFLPLAIGFALMAAEFLRLLKRGESLLVEAAERRETL